MHRICAGHHSFEASRPPASIFPRTHASFAVQVQSGVSLEVEEHQSFLDILMNGESPKNSGSYSALQSCLVGYYLSQNVRYANARFIIWPGAHCSF